MEQLDQAPQGAPASKSLSKILDVLFTEEEAQAVSILPMNFFTIDEAARLLKKSSIETRLILDTLADKGLLFDFATGATQAYLMAATMAGFFEFSLMRLDGRFDKRLVSNSGLGTATSANWKTICRAWRTIRPPILISFT